MLLVSATFLVFPNLCITLGARAVGNTPFYSGVMDASSHLDPTNSANAIFQLRRLARNMIAFYWLTFWLCKLCSLAGKWCVSLG
eukprot:1007394-Pyramimonas_sp.AAC.1